MVDTACSLWTQVLPWNRYTLTPIRNNPNRYPANSYMMTTACSVVAGADARQLGVERIYNLMTYEQYLQSDQWREKQQARMHVDNYTCRMCGSHSDLQIHHMTYRNIMHEDVMRDLVCVCDSCHRKIHTLMCRPTAILPDGSGYRYGWKDNDRLPAGIKRDLMARGLM